jgi:hypothetical protein
MTDLPDPLTPPDCDLRGYDFMPLFGGKLFGSRLYTKALRNPRAGLAAIKLWWIAWQQCPAGSLPDDDDDLAMLADFGTDAKGWRAVREIALHGFVLCADGRLYHPILCTEALDAFERRRKERERKAQQRAKKEGTGGGSPSTVPQDVPRDTTRTEPGPAVDVRADRTGQDRTGQLEELPSVVARDADAPTSARTGSRLPDDWTPGDDGYRFAEDLGLDPNRVLASFGDYWRGKPGKDGRKADWPATWRNWCRRDAERARPNSANRQQPQSRFEHWDRIAESLDRIKNSPGYPQ